MTAEILFHPSPIFFALPLNQIKKINWQTLGVGFRTTAQVANGIARSRAND